MTVIENRGKKRARSKSDKGFTLIELVVVIAVIGFLSSVVLAVLTDARIDARDKRRVEDLKQLEVALNLYHNDHNAYPKESESANGDVAENAVFGAMLDEYIAAMPVDPSGAGDDTFFYYYDGRHNCGGTFYAVIFARQMDKADNSNYDTFLNTTCAGTLDGEGRGSGTGSYNIIVGNSSG
jgi:general secretion pathway protein G